MSKKQSLGHNPLAYSLRNHGSFDFIRDTQGKNGNQQKEPVISKKVASYYLEESVIEKVREIAEQQDDSYSGVANRLLKEALKKEE